MNGALWEEFVQMDNSAETTSTGPINSVATPVEAKTEDQEEEEQELDDEQVITSKQALEHTKALLHFASKAGGEGGSRAGVRLIESSECCGGHSNQGERTGKAKEHDRLFIKIN